MGSAGASESDSEEIYTKALEEFAEAERCQVMLELAANEAMDTSTRGIGGPFGATVVKVNDDGTSQVFVASNTVLSTNDPTAHAEINAIRKAAKELGTYDLSGCKLYATSAPCPMCRSAIIWSNIKTVYYANTVKDAAKIGFRDDFMYNYFSEQCKDESVMKLIQVNSRECVDLLDNYAKSNLTIY